MSAESPNSASAQTKASERRLTGDQVTTFLSVTHAIEHILSASLPPLFPLIQKALGLSYTEIGLITTVRSTASGLIQAPAGTLVDKMGARKPLAIGFAIVSLALLLSGLAPTFGILLAVQVLSGLGSSAFHPATYAIVSRVAAGKNVGKKLSFHTFGGFAGTTVSFVLVAFLGARFGWRNALIVLSIPGFFLAYLFWTLFNVPEQEAPKPKEKKAQSASRAPTSAILALIGVTTVHGMFSRGLSAFMPLFLAATYKMTVQEAGIYSTIMTGTGCVGLLLGGWLADRFPKTTVITVSSLGMAFTCFFLAGTPMSKAMLALVLMVSGLTQYSSNPSQTSLVTTFGSPEGQGSLFGLTFASSFLGGSLMGVVAGKVADIYGVGSIFYMLAVLASARALMTIPLGRASRIAREHLQAAGD